MQATSPQYHTHTQPHRHIHTHSHTETHTQTHTHIENYVETHTHTHTHTETHRLTQTHTDSHTDTHRNTLTDTLTHAAVKGRLRHFGKSSCLQFCLKIDMNFVSVRSDFNQLCDVCVEAVMSAAASRGRWVKYFRI